MKYPKILYQDASFTDKSQPRVDRNIEAVMKAAGCHGTTLIFSDTMRECDGVAVVTSEGLAKAYDSYDQVILDLSDPRSFADLESIFQQIFLFMDKVRVGGRILVPESTYCHLPYGIEGMEILFKVSGMLIELPNAGLPGLLTATVL